MIKIPGKIPINIYPIFLIFITLVSLMNSYSVFDFFVWMVVIFISVVVHEMGHAITAVSFGQKAHIDLLGFGGLTHRHGKRLNAWRDFLIVLNGPLAGFSLCVISYFLLRLPIHYSQNGMYILQLFLYANIFWTIVNLLPVQPLDGGHLLRILLEGIFGLRGVKIALFISLLLAVGMTILFFILNSMIGGILFMFLTFENYRAWSTSMSLTSADQSEPLQIMLKQAQADFKQGNPHEAIVKLEEIRKSGGKGVLYISATLLEAEILNHLHNQQDAYELLLPVQNRLSSQGLILLQDLAYQCRQWDEAIHAGTKAYQEAPDYRIALLNAMSHAQKSEAQPAVGWLKCAFREGLANGTDILKQREFDPIRLDPVFQSFNANHIP